MAAAGRFVLFSDVEVIVFSEQPEKNDEEGFSGNLSNLKNGEEQEAPIHLRLFERFNCQLRKSDYEFYKFFQHLNYFRIILLDCTGRLCCWLSHCLEKRYLQTWISVMRHIVHTIKTTLHARSKIWKWCSCLAWAISHEWARGVSTADGVRYFSPHSNIKLKSSHARLKSSLYYFCGTARMCLENVTKLSLGSFPGRNIWLCLFASHDIANWTTNWPWYLWRIGIDLERERPLSLEISCNVN